MTGLSAPMVSAWWLVIGVLPMLGWILNPGFRREARANFALGVNPVYTVAKVFPLSQGECLSLTGVIVVHRNIGGVLSARTLELQANARRPGATALPEGNPTIVTNGGGSAVTIDWATGTDPKTIELGIRSPEGGVANVQLILNESRSYP